MSYDPEPSTVIRSVRNDHAATSGTKKGISAAKIGDIAREQNEARLKQQNKKLLAQRKKPIVPPTEREKQRTANVTQLELADRELADISELNFFTNLQCVCHVHAHAPWALFTRVLRKHTTPPDCQSYRHTQHPP